MPKLSVVMPVYNVAKYVKEAVTSVLSQTFNDFELIIIDDHSTDNTVDIINSIKDSRIIFFRNDKNLGRSVTDNLAIQYIRGQYVAKMDGDDICLPQRFERQLDFLDKNPSVNVVGCYVKNFGASTYLNKYPSTIDESKVQTLFNIPAANASTMFRSSLFVEEGLKYDESLRQTEDYRFFAKYIDELNVVSIKEALYLYRTFPVRIRADVFQERDRVSNNIRVQLLHKIGIPYNDWDAKVHNTIALKNVEADGLSLTECNNWLLKLIDYNNKAGYFNRYALKKIVAEHWFHLCYLNPGKRFHGYSTYLQSGLKAHSPISFYLKSKFLLKSVENFF
jgi:glycosyltransferase involved in cell wall biosynthesis